MFRLALALGMTIGHIKREMSSLELAAWIAYDRVSPIGPERQDINHAIGTAVLANAHRGKGSRQFKPQDFLPFLEDSSRATTAEEMKRRFQMLVRPKSKGPS